MRFHRSYYVFPLSIVPTPMVSVSHDGPSNTILPGGSRVTFTCTITMDPAVNTSVTVMATWTTTGDRTGLSGSDPAVVQGAPVPTYQSSLTLDNLLTSDSGNYICTASVVSSEPFTSSAQEAGTVTITVGKQPYRNSVVHSLCKQ